MGGFGSVWHWVIVLLVIVLLFGAKKIPELAKGLGSGIKNFKKAVKEDEEDIEIDATSIKTVEKEAIEPVEKKPKTTRTYTKKTTATKVASKENATSEPKKRGRKPKEQTNV